MRDVAGYPNYAVTHDGRIWSKRIGSFLRLFQNNKGYQVVSLYDSEGRQRQFLVHRVVALNYLPNPLGLKEVNHIDANKRNNAVENLEWCTREKNRKHAQEHGLFKTWARYRKLSWEQVCEIRESKGLTNNSECARKYGCTQSTVSRIRSGKHRTCDTVIGKKKEPA